MPSLYTICTLFANIINYLCTIFAQDIDGDVSNEYTDVVEVDGQKLQKLRRRRLWLIGDLADKSGVHRNTISKLENGKGGAYPETIRRLADALEVDPTELIRE